MLFAIRFNDHPSKLRVRQQYLESHIEWLKQNRDVVKAAGSLRENQNDQPLGALWVVEARNEDDALSILSNDPFWVNGLRASVEILSWHLAFDDMFVE